MIKSKVELQLKESFDVKKFKAALRNAMKSKDPDFDIEDVELRNVNTLGSGWMSAHMFITYSKNRFVHANAIMGMIQSVLDKDVKINSVLDIKE